MSITTNYNINGTDLGNILQTYNPSIQFTSFPTNSNIINTVCSQNGMYIAVIYIYNNITYLGLSSNYGSTWTSSGTIAFNTISMSSDGKYLLGGDNTYLYVSNNYGISFIFTKITTMTGTWSSSSIFPYNGSIGQCMVAGQSVGYIYYSSNYGVNWTKTTAPLGSWSNISNSNGITSLYPYIYACESSIPTGTLYFSAVTGSIWTPITSLNSTVPTCVACDTLGQNVIVGTIGHGVYLSSDKGQTFIHNTFLPYNSNIKYMSVWSDGTGQYLVASYLNLNTNVGASYISNNYGANWTKLGGVVGNSNIYCMTGPNIVSYIIYNIYNQTTLYKYNFGLIQTTGYSINYSDINQIILPPQGTTDYFKANWGSTVALYQTLGTDILSFFSPITTVYGSSGSYTHTLKNSTQRYAILLVGGGGGGMGGTRYSGGGNGAGGGGGASGQWVFAYSNYTITNRTLNITIGAGGTGSIGVDTSSSYEYPITAPTAGGSSSVSISGTTILQANGGLVSTGFTSGNVGSPGGLTNSTPITINTSFGIASLYSSNGVAGSYGANSQTTNPPGGAGGINNYLPIGINNNFTSSNQITLTNYGSGQTGGYGEGTNNVGGCQEGINVVPAAGNGLAIIFEYISSPDFTLYTSGINNIITTTSDCKGIYAILIGGGGGGGSGGANSNGTGGAGGGGGGGALGIIYIPNPNIGSAMTINYTIGSGGSGASVLTGNGTGLAGSAGSATSINYNGITYSANGGAGGAGGTSNITGGAGGAGGTVSGGTFLNQNNGISGSIGMSKSGTNQVMGGIGGLNGNYAVTYNVPLPAATNPTPTITYTITSQNVTNNNAINLVSLTNAFGIVQNGSGQHYAPSITYNTYYGQGGYGGDSDTNTSGDFGFAGSNGQPGLLILYGCSINYYGVPFTLSGTATSQILNGYNLITLTKGSGSVYFNLATTISIICVGGGGGGAFGNNSYDGGGGGGGGAFFCQTNINTKTTLNINVGSGGSGGTNTSNTGSGSSSTVSLVYNSTTYPFITCSGGGAGQSKALGSNSGSGPAGTVSVSTINTPLISNSNISGTGGAGGNVASDGYSSDSYTNNFAIPSAINTVVKGSYSGGGGGGGKASYGDNGAYAGSNGAGGGQNYSSSNYNGQNASTYGSGGGGAGGNSTLIINSNGGSGADGIVYIYYKM
jgi:hypothetical protein